MKIYVDSADIKEIQAAQAVGLCDGVTTNPTLIARSGKPMARAIEEICAIVDGPVHAEVLSLDEHGMLEEGRRLAGIAPNVVVKIPMCNAGLKAVKRFADEGIRTNVTLIFSAAQAILAAKAGATNVCPFIGRLDDISASGTALIRDIAGILGNYPALRTEIVAASMRHPMHVVECALIGAHVLTIPGGVLSQMEKHPLTEAGIARFLEDAKKLT